MRLVQLVFPGVMPGLILLFVACQPTSGDDLGEAVQVAIRKVEASIVRLRVIGGEQSIDGDAVRSLDTTGIVISEDGEILTSQFRQLQKYLQVSSEASKKLLYNINSQNFLPPAPVGVAEA